MRHDFSKDVMRKRFVTAWFSSIMISRIQKLFDENIFLPFQLQKIQEVCGRKEPYSLASILFTNYAVITRTNCARETQKSNMLERAMCCARETDNLL